MKRTYVRIRVARGLTRSVPCRNPHPTNDPLPLLALAVAMLITLVPVLAAGSRAAAP